MEFVCRDKVIFINKEFLRRSPVLFKEYEKDRIIVYDHEILKKYNSNIIKCLLDYISLYGNTSDENYIEDNFHHRNLATLLNGIDYSIIVAPYFTGNLKHDVKFITHLLGVSANLQMKNLAEKCGAIFALLIKDQPIEKIQEFI